MLSQICRQHDAAKLWQLCNTCYLAWQTGRLRRPELLLAASLQAKQLSLPHLPTKTCTDDSPEIHACSKIWWQQVEKGAESQLQMLLISLELGTG